MISACCGIYIKTLKGKSRKSKTLAVGSSQKRISWIQTSVLDQSLRDKTVPLEVESIFMNNSNFTEVDSTVDDSGCGFYKHVLTKHMSCK